jgi:hypothetical protein
MHGHDHEFVIEFYRYASTFRRKLIYGKIRFKSNQTDVPRLLCKQGTLCRRQLFFGSKE